VPFWCRLDRKRPREGLQVVDFRSTETTILSIVGKFLVPRVLNFTGRSPNASTIAARTPSPFPFTALGLLTIHTVAKRFGQLEALDVKRLRHLEAENTRLTKVLAERVMDIEILKEVAAKKW
jgi:hypothetical protein